MERKKILIFIVAYKSKNLIQKVIDRIPRNFLKKYNCQILVIDDASKDGTFESALEYAKIHPYLNMKVLFNPENQGYGGNQKIGYQYAINNNFDIVVLLHGDGQYAPEIIEEMVSPIIKGEAEMVLGSRMISPFMALKGGMPIYKFIGNKILTFIQNKILGSKLSEFHSGYRCYSVEALKKIPFQFNSNYFDFDTEIIIQFLLRNYRIKEIPIPTYYGDEICYVNGIKYAYRVLKTTLHSKLMKLGIFYTPKYDLFPSYSSKLEFLSSHSLAVKRIEEKSKVLDIGCGNFIVSKELKKKGCYVVGIDQQEIEDSSILNEFIKIDIEKENLPPIEKFDYILLLDVLEHLKQPEKLLIQIRESAKGKKPIVIITVPNVAFFITRFQLFLGNFNYGKRGILDFTHCRMFTISTIKSLLVQYGYKIKKIRGIPAPYPLAIKRKIGKILLEINKFLIIFFPGLFSYQVYIECVPLPTVDELLQWSQRETFKFISENKKNDEE